MLTSNTQAFINKQQYGKKIKKKIVDVFKPFRITKKLRSK
jgi:hypothetical protein